MDLLEALKSLDVTDDSLWTDEGLPTIDATKAASGLTKVTRSLINEVALGLTRQNAKDFVPLNAEPVAESVTETVADVELEFNAVNVELNSLLAQKEALDTKVKEISNRQAVLSVEVDKTKKELTYSDIHGQIQDALQQDLAVKIEQSKTLKLQGFTDEQIERILGG